jgi:putative N6-adenine-specific DNA methylase
VSSDTFFATCPRGLEGVLAQELTALAATDIRAADGGVQFTGALTIGYAVNLWSRVASRVLWRVHRSRYRTEHDIFNAARKLDWARWFGVERTLRVDVSAIKSPVKSLEFVTLRVKDAICDTFRTRHGKRPSIDTHVPDVRVQAFLTAGELTLYIDLSGEPLFKRGYRHETGAAPLRENLAAGLLRLAHWEPGMTLLDPMCGSGTTLCEAAMLAANRAPGVARTFGFEKLLNFNTQAWDEMRRKAKANETTIAPSTLFGSDLRGDALKIARANLEALGYASAVTLKQANVLEMPPPAASGIIVTNPPYGVRLEETADLAAFYPRLGDTLKKRYAGWTAYLLSGDMQLPKKIGLAASKRTPLFNGALECRLFEYKVVAGSNRR